MDELTVAGIVVFLISTTYWMRSLIKAGHEVKSLKLISPAYHESQISPATRLDPTTNPSAQPDQDKQIAPPPLTPVSRPPQTADILAKLELTQPTDPVTTPPQSV